MNRACGRWRSGRRHETEPEIWSDARVWQARNEWGRILPSARHVIAEECELAVTPDASKISRPYGFRGTPPPGAESVLDWLREQLTSLGGGVVKVQITPTSEPQALPQRLLRQNYVPAEETEVLVWELRNTARSPRLPGFPIHDRTEVREIRTDPDTKSFWT